MPGESYLAVLDALHDVADRLAFVVCRQEGGAAYMAEAYGKLTGRPGIALVTRGPGATNAAVGVHTAAQDSTPLILLVGQVGTDMVDREAFQEIDYRRMYGGVAKWARRSTGRNAFPNTSRTHIERAMGGRPGPVVLALARGHAGRARGRADAPRVEALPIAPTAGQLAGRPRMRSRAPSARCCSSAAAAGTPPRARRCATLAERTGLPVACAFRHQDLFDNRASELRRRRRYRHQSRSSPRACATPTCCWSSASGWAR